MTVKKQNYLAERDFPRIRDFLKKNYYIDGKPFNWGLERWNWGRYHPGMFDDKAPKQETANITYWEKCVRFWENNQGEIVAIVNTETPIKDGETFFHRTSEYDFLIDEMFDFAESHHMHSEENYVQLPVYTYDNALVKKAKQRGYEIDKDNADINAEYIIDTIPGENLKSGFSISSMAEGGDLAMRCKCIGLGFNHPDPADWTCPAEYKKVQAAPDYKPELDLFVKSPNGDYASGCIIWYDDYNNIAFLEPVCTMPKYRRMGFGREVIMEGIRRVAAMGAKKVYVGSSQEFYKAIGFRMKYTKYFWKKKFNTGK